jgi:uncharacterized protein YigE (DUF2233 family)
MRALLLLGMALLAAATARAAEPHCRDMRFEDARYVVCQVQAGEDLRLFLDGPSGPWAGFAPLQIALAQQGLDLVFAMNAGMYRPDLSPAGLYVEEGREVTRLVTRDGPGNFGLLPNGVFCIGAAFAVIESRRFAAERPDCRFATQSGPMLVIAGALHPRFKTDSVSLNIRNGVGVSADGRTAWLALSAEPVNFAAFARLFRDGLGAPNALYLDGSISRLYAPDLGRSGAGFAIGPILGLVAPQGDN